MTAPDTDARVRAIIAEVLAVPLAELVDTPIAEQGADSLDAIEIAMRIEHELDVVLGEEDLAAAETPGDYASLVARRKAGA